MILARIKKCLSFNSGFTVIEAIVAVLVASSVITVMLSALTTTTQSAGYAKKEIQIQNEAQQTMNLLEDNVVTYSDIVLLNGAAPSATVNTADTWVDITSVTFSLSINGTEYEDVYTYDSAARTIQYKRTGVMGVVMEGLFAENISTFALLERKDVALSKDTLMSFRLGLKYSDREIVVQNSAKFRR